MTKKIYSEATLRKKALEAGYSIEKGFQHYMGNGCVVPDRRTGYMLQDLSTGCYVWGSYDIYRDHTWQLEDVQKFLESVYKEAGIDF